MGFNRIEAKFNAKISMRQTRPSPIWITALFLLLTVIVKQVVVAVVGDPFVEMGAAPYMPTSQECMLSASTCMSVECGQRQKMMCFLKLNKYLPILFSCWGYRDLLQ